MTQSGQREELAKFLRTRRETLSIAAAGLRPTARRRTPGLRREEVADLAGVSVTWYTWLEQGRDIQCSVALLARLATALRLTRTDSDYLFRLAGHSPPSRPAQVPTVEPAIQAVFDGFTAGPALLLGPRLDVLAFNHRADRVFLFDDYNGPFQGNHLWRGFMDPQRRRLYIDWELMMARAVAVLRASYATRIGDEAFETLIASLREHSEEFARMWEERRTLPLDSIRIRMATRDLGELTFVSTRLTLPALSEHVAFFLSPDDDNTARAMRGAI
jgi:transcriptional regulator with XRE-family HTH domain